MVLPLSYLGVSRQHRNATTVLRRRLHIDISARYLGNCCRVPAAALQRFKRLTGRANVHAIRRQGRLYMSLELSNSMAVEPV